jgi:hypothetical protein
MKNLEAADLVDKACSQLGHDRSALIALVSIWIDPQVVENLAPVAGMWYPQHRRANLGRRFCAAATFAPIVFHDFPAASCESRRSLSDPPGPT